MSNEKQLSECGQTEAKYDGGNSSSSSSGGSTTISWEFAQNILVLLQEKITQSMGKLIKLNSEPYLGRFKDLFSEDHMAYWTVLDQLHDIFTRFREQAAEYPLDDLVMEVQPIPVEADGVSEEEFVRMLLVKLWPREHGAIIVYPETEHERIVSGAIAAVYTWENAEAAIRQVEANINTITSHKVSFDVKHFHDLHEIYNSDPLGFWSVLDQIQDRMMGADWDGVRNNARFIQSFVKSFEPVNYLLTPFMASIIPRHPLVPYRYPPHILRIPGAFANIDRAHLQPASDLSVTANYGTTAATTTTMASNNSALSSSPPVSSTINVQHYRHHHNQQQTHFAHTSPTQNLLEPSMPSVSPPSTLSSVKTRLTSSGSTQYRHNFNQNYFAYNNSNSAGSNASTFADTDTQGRVPWQYSWRNALRVINEIADSVKSVRITFDDKHTHDLRTRWEQDPVSFFSILDQIHEKFLQTNWDAVRDIARYIQSLINKTVPQPSLSPFIVTFLCSATATTSTAIASTVHSSSPSSSSRDTSPQPALSYDLGMMGMNALPQVTAAPMMSNGRAPRYLGYEPHLSLGSSFCGNENNLSVVNESSLWNRVASFILPHVEMSLTQSAGRLIKFNEAHKNDLKQLLEIDPDGFWWILDRTHNTLKTSDWSCVTDVAHYIQACIRSIAAKKYGVTDGRSGSSSSSTSLFPSPSACAPAAAPASAAVLFPSNADETTMLSPFMQELIAAMCDEKIVGSSFNWDS